MARLKKDARPFSIKMESDTYERLQSYCEQSGQSKTIAIERAINMFIDDYNLKMEQIQKSKVHGINEHIGQ